MKFKKIASVSIMSVFAVMLSSCSIFLPYEEKFSCRKGDSTGLCGSVSDVYEFYNKGYSIEDIKNNKKGPKEEIKWEKMW